MSIQPSPGILYEPRSTEPKSSKMYLLDVAPLFKKIRIDPADLQKTEEIITRSYIIEDYVVSQEVVPDTIILLTVSKGSAPLLKESLAYCKQLYPNMYPPTILDGRKVGFELAVNMGGNVVLKTPSVKVHPSIPIGYQNEITNCLRQCNEFIKEHWNTEVNFPEYHKTLAK